MMDASRIIELKESLLAEDGAYADSLRDELSAEGCLVVNIMGSPGAGKTGLILATLARLPVDTKTAVIEADLDATVDAEAVEAAGFEVVQLHTGGFCHIDARMTARGLAAFGLGPEAMKIEASQRRAALRLVLVENVGNLICTAQCDAGAHVDVALLSLPEGDDKPLKYPVMFRAADIVIVTKLDFAPYQSFDLAVFRDRVRYLNPEAPILALSAKTGEGMEAWMEYIARKCDPTTGGISS